MAADAVGARKGEDRWAGRSDPGRCRERGRLYMECHRDQPTRSRRRVRAHPSPADGLPAHWAQRITRVPLIFRR